MMSKKNRFSMLEVENKKATSNKASINKTSEKDNRQNKSNGNKVIKRDFKVLIDDNEFKNNLKIHQLKNQKKEIKKEKSKLLKQINQIKFQAYLQIGLGLGLVIHGTYNLLTQRIESYGQSLGGDRFEVFKTVHIGNFTKDHYIQFISLIIGVVVLYNSIKRMNKNDRIKSKMQNTSKQKKRIKK